MKLLFITANPLGDAVLSTGILAALIECHPGIEVTIACGPIPAPLFRECPNVMQVIELVKAPLAGHWRRLWRQVAFRRWDIVVDLRQSAVSRLILAKHAIRARPHPARVHKVTELAAAAKILPLPMPRLWLSEADHTEAAILVPGDRPVLALAPGAKSIGKRWPAERYAQFARAAIDEDGFLPGGRVLIVGDDPDRPVTSIVAAKLPPDRVIDLTGRTGVTLTAACIARASLYVGNDSGVTHLAAAAGVRTLALFGPGVAWKYRPWGEHAAYVSNADDPEREYDLCRDGDDDAALELMKRLSIDDVMDAAERLWHKTAL